MQSVRQTDKKNTQICTCTHFILHKRVNKSKQIKTEWKGPTVCVCVFLRAKPVWQVKILLRESRYQSNEQKEKPSKPQRHGKVHLHTRSSKLAAFPKVQRKKKKGINQTVGRFGSHSVHVCKVTGSHRSHSTSAT